MPANFSSFLHDSTNKEELFRLLSADVAKAIFPENKEVYATLGESVVTSGSSETMPNTDHEEADTRVCLHILDALKRGAKSVLVSTVDTDIVVILLGVFVDLKAQDSDFQL